MRYESVRGFISLFVLALLTLNSSVVFCASRAATKPLTPYCDPFVGVDGGGNTVPGATTPYGFATHSPYTLQHDTSGYDSKQPIIGFSQTHVSGTGGASKYGNFRITPEVGELKTTDLASAKKDETASPGYYAVTLTRPDVRVELTASRLVAVHRYTFPKSTASHLLLDVSSIVIAGGEQRQRDVDCSVTIVASDRIEGTGQFKGGWNPAPYTLHFSAEFSRAPSGYGVWSGDALQPGKTSIHGKDQTGVYLTVDTTREAAN